MKLKKVTMALGLITTLTNAFALENGRYELVPSDNLMTPGSCLNEVISPQLHYVKHVDLDFSSRDTLISFDRREVYNNFEISEWSSNPFNCKNNSLQCVLFDKGLKRSYTRRASGIRGVYGVKYEVSISEKSSSLEILVRSKESILGLGGKWTEHKCLLKKVSSDSVFPIPLSRPLVRVPMQNLDYECSRKTGEAVSLRLQRDGVINKLTPVRSVEIEVGKKYEVSVNTTSVTKTFIVRARNSCNDLDITEKL